MIEFAHLQAFVMVLLAICSVIAAIAGAAAAVTKYWRFAHKQSDKNTEDIEEFKDWFAKDKYRINELEKRQDKVEELNRLQLEAMFVILQHITDGNHIDQVRDVRDKINHYLIVK